jgi:dihydropteroate synthase
MTDMEEQHSLSGLQSELQPLDHWSLAHGRRLALDQRPLVMGIVNVTPDSFSDGGHFVQAEAAIAHARTLAEEGADIVDIGGESTRPGADDVSVEEELGRVIPVIRGLADLGIPISIDTRRAQVMTEAVAAGAAIINDVTGLTFEAESREAAMASGAGIVIMHSKGAPKTMQTAPRYDDVTAEVIAWLDHQIQAALQAGIDRDRMVADPGIGFGKTTQHNLTLLHQIEAFHGLGMPVLVGASRKRFIGTLGHAPNAQDRLPGSLAIALWAAQKGVQILRVHDVAETQQALAIQKAIMQA